MKSLLLICALILAGVSYAQTDTVCLGTNSVTYDIPQPSTGTIVWNITAPGIIVSGQGTNSIVVDWSGASVAFINDAVTVSLTNTNCPVTPQTLDVEIINPIVNILPTSPLCLTDPCITLTTVPNISGTWIGVGLSGNSFCPNISGSGVFNLVFNGTLYGCNVTSNTSITVNNIITLGNITY